VLPWAGSLLDTWLCAVVDTGLCLASRRFAPAEETELTQTFGAASERYRFEPETGVALKACGRQLMTLDTHDAGTGPIR
jgi:hypothetical protein